MAWSQTVSYTHLDVYKRQEHRAGLEDALKACSHGHLLVELRALCQIGIAVEVVHLSLIHI